MDHNELYKSGWHSTLLITYFQNKDKHIFCPYCFYNGWKINTQKCLKSVTTKHLVLGVNFLNISVYSAQKQWPPFCQSQMEGE